MTRDEVVALVACTAQKLPFAAPARDLYTASPWFRAAIPLAERLASNVWILSAKHHLVEPHEMIAPYQKTLKRMTRQEQNNWADEVESALDGELGFRSARYVVWFAGRDYRDLLILRLHGYSKNHFIPMAGMRLGQQISWLQSNRDLDLAGLGHWCAQDSRRIVNGSSAARSTSDL